MHHDEESLRCERWFTQKEIMCKSDLAGGQKLC